MPFGFKRSILTSESGSAAALESILTINGASQASSYSPLYSRSFTKVKDELNIFGTATTDGSASSIAKYMPIANGTYNVEITAINGVPTSSTYFSPATMRFVHRGSLFNSSGNINPYYGSGTLQVAAANDGGTSQWNNLPSLPYSFGSITYDSSNQDLKGVWSVWSPPYGGHSASFPSWTMRFTAT
jgi:hypothetical protein